MFLQEKKKCLQTLIRYLNFFDIGNMFVVEGKEISELKCKGTVTNFYSKDLFEN